MEQQNILLITSDQQHFMTLGVNNPDIKTPNLDRLAEMGMAMDRAYCPNPTCTPSRASIITGKYPSQHGAWSLGTKLQESQQTIGEILKQYGYTSTLIGKAHFQPLDQTSKYSSLECLPLLHDLEFWDKKRHDFYGFDNIELLRNHTDERWVGQHYALWLEEKGFTDWKNYFQPPLGNRTDIQDIGETIKQEYLGNKVEKKWGEWKIPVEQHYNSWISERVNNHIEQSQINENPFFIWASFPDPHPDYLVPEPYASMYDPQNLNLQLLSEKEIANPLVDKTRKLNPDYSEFQESGFYLHGCHSHLQTVDSIRQDAAWYYGMVTFMDEHIGKILDKLEELCILDSTLIIFTTDHGHFFGQHGLTRKGPFSYEDMIKIPFIVSCPDWVTHAKSSAIISLVDIVPTLLDIIGIEIPCDITGVSQKNVWNGSEEKVRSHAICENRCEQNNLNMRTYIGERYKLTIYQDKEFGDLYDLLKDPYEKYNLWENPEFTELKLNLLLKYASAELEKEAIAMPKIDGA